MTQEWLQGFDGLRITLRVPEFEDDPRGPEFKDGFKPSTIQR
jgi:hypothetical protein